MQHEVRLKNTPANDYSISYRIIYSLCVAFLSRTGLLCRNAGESISILTPPIAQPANRFPLCSFI